MRTERRSYRSAKVLKSSSAGAVERDESELVEVEQIEACEALPEAAKLLLVLGLDELLDDVGGAPERDVVIGAERRGG